MNDTESFDCHLPPKGTKFLFKGICQTVTIDEDDNGSHFTSINAIFSIPRPSKQAKDTDEAK